MEVDIWHLYVQGVWHVGGVAPRGCGTLGCVAFEEIRNMWSMKNLWLNDIGFVQIGH